MKQHIFYREPRETLSEALSTAIEFESIPALIAYICNREDCTPECLVFHCYGFDDRCNWWTFCVNVKDYPVGWLGFVIE